MSKPPVTAKAGSHVQAAAAAPTGCCNVLLDDGSGQQFEHITEDECKQKAIALGGTAQWVPGDCA